MSAIPVALDKMQDRAIRGTTGRRAYAVVLDAPQGATGIFSASF